MLCHCEERSDAAIYKAENGTGESWCHTDLYFANAKYKRKPGVAGWRLKPARRGGEQAQTLFVNVRQGKAFP